MQSMRLQLRHWLKGVFYLLALVKLTIIAVLSFFILHTFVYNEDK